MKMIKPQIQRAQETPSTRNIKKMTPIILVLLKVFNSNKKDKIIKTAREKRHVIHKGTKMKLQSSHQNLCKPEDKRMTSLKR